MNLIDESYNTKKDNKKVFLGLGIGIAVLILIIVALVSYVSIVNSNKVKFYVDAKQYNASDYLIQKDGVYYVGIENLTNITNNGYKFKSGDTSAEDDNKCYITNSLESTFFKVDSKEIYKILEETNEIEYYTLDNAVIKENGKMYIPITGVDIAMNTSFSSNKNQLVITSIGWRKNDFTTKNNVDSSIVWNTSYSNDKLLRNRLAVIKDDTDQLGVGRIKTETDSKTKKTKTVIESSIITPKYKSIEYVEKYNQLIVESENGDKGIIQLSEENGNFSAKTIINPQYKSVKPISEDMFIVSEESIVADAEGNSKTSEKYGVIKVDGSNRNTILPMSYDKIGIDASMYTNNNLKSSYIIYDNLIPVMQNNLWGFSNLKGSIIIKCKYAEVGCSSTNPNSNVLIIPELNGIVVKDNKSYEVISRSGKSLVSKLEINRIYKEAVNGSDQYNMVLNNGKTQNIVDYYVNSTKSN